MATINGRWGEGRSATVSQIPAWHSHELIFGFLGAVLAGFLLTATSRWTRRDIGTWSRRLILAAWIAGRFAPAPPSAFALIAILPMALLATTLTFHVLKAGDWRDLKVVALLWLFTAGGAFHAIAGNLEKGALGLRLAFAAAIALMIVIGGRVVPALSAHYMSRRGGVPRQRAGPVTEFVVAMSAIVGSAAWLFHPSGAGAAAACCLATGGQVFRLALCGNWRSLGSPALVGLHAAYAAIPAGFALMAVSALKPDLVPESAGLHLWAVGGFGGMTLSIMSSMIRRRSGQAFVVSLAGKWTLICILSAAILRTAVALAYPVLTMAAVAWIAAFAFFVFDFRALLLRWTGAK